MLTSLSTSESHAAASLGVGRCVDAATSIRMSGASASFGLRKEGRRVRAHNDDDELHAEHRPNGPDATWSLEAMRLCLRSLDDVPTRFPTAIAASESVLFVGCRNGSLLCIGNDSQRLLALRPCPRPNLRRRDDDEVVVCLAVHPRRRTVVAIARLNGVIELVCTKRRVPNTLRTLQTHSNNGRISALQFDASVGVMSSMRWMHG